MKVVRSCLGTKMMSKWMDLAVKISMDAVRTVVVDQGDRKEIDIKRYVRIEKVKIHFSFFFPKFFRLGEIILRIAPSFHWMISFVTKI